mmetsp:Transcript_5686/g.16438  ORF Transcript_5686/g.16438 Transcript_5686/m.16438 type:complete len:93 (-) Transcript_5686:203-481(-)
MGPRRKRQQSRIKSAASLSHCRYKTIFEVEASDKSPVFHANGVLSRDDLSCSTLQLYESCSGDPMSNGTNVCVSTFHLSTLCADHISPTEEA